MRNDLTEIVFILDKSGSMNGIKQDAIGGFNSFVEEQRKAEGYANFTGILFDNAVLTIYNGESIDVVTEMTENTYRPSGLTALLDAIGIGIDTVGKRLAETPEEERASKVIFAIMTDGQENSSKEYTKQRINEMIAHQTEVYNWQFIFLGANIDAVSTAEGLGIKGMYAGQFNARGTGGSTAMLHASEMVLSYRDAGVLQSYAEVAGKQIAESGIDIGEALKGINKKANEKENKEDKGE